ncbi:CAP domain-containing protein [Streptomyces sp. NPDC020801]|uniref:CAP domain-containing protein n=1 Tax=unclassified Streptomyces TaxID=2593676 RepID=UPI003798779E
MGKHRKKQHRRIAVAALAIGAVGIPSVAMACTDWPDSGRSQFHGAQQNAARKWRHDTDPHRGRTGDWNSGWNSSWNRDEDRPARPAASKTPAPSASAPRTAAPRHTAPEPRSTAPASTATTTAARPRTTPPPSPPKATVPASASATPPAPSAPTATATASGTTARIVELVNAERAQAGCSPLTLNATLTKVAQAHSEDMAAHQNMSHSGSDGSSPGDRITRAGYLWSTYGENVAYGYATPEQVMAAWMASPGHKANILNCAFKEIGVGLAQPNAYWTQDFATTQ